jgi:transposase
MSDPANLIFWNQHLGLDGYTVMAEERHTAARTIRLTLEATAEVALCPHCQQPSATVHRTLDSDTIHDLPHGPQRLELILRQQQFQCPACQRFFTPPCPHVAHGVHATERFLAHAATLIRFADIDNAAAFFGLPAKTLERWYYGYVERTRQTAAPLKPITSLGIDELSLKKNTASS